MASALDQPPLRLATTQEPLFAKTLSTEPIQTDSTILPTTSPSPAPATSHTETTQQFAPSPSAHDEGYVPRGSQRKLIDGRWGIIQDEHKAPDDVYGDAETFPEQSATVQIVTFFMEGYVGQNPDIQAKWENPLTSPLAMRGVLRKPQEPRTWRWIHCEGLHGPTMKIIAEETSMCLPS
jgi:hypothetical protein